MAFDREKFLKANRELQEKRGQGFKEHPAGIYNVKLIDAGLNQAKSSGREQATFVWEIEPPDDIQGQKIYEHFGLEDGEVPLIIRLNSLGVQDGQMLEQFTLEFEKNLAYMANRAKARIKLEYVPGKNNPAVEFQRIKLLKLFEGPFPNGQLPNGQTSQPKEEVQTQSVPPETGPDIANESKIVVKYNGKPEVCKVLNYMKPTGKLFVEFDDTKLGKSAVDVKDVISTSIDPTPPFDATSSVVEEIVEEVVEEIVEEIPIQVGMNVKFTYQAKELTGIIHELIQAENAVKVQYTDPNDKKQKRIKIAIDKLTPIS